MIFALKKGELSSQQLILWILAILSFVIILVFVYLMYSANYTEDELCHLSVLSRATAPTSLQQGVSLNCKPTKVCFTQGGAPCTDTFAGEKPEVVQLPSNPDEAAYLISKRSAEAMYSCWKMMGEGKLDIAGSATQQFMGKTESTCLICSRLAVDKSVKADVLQKTDINEYMRKNQIPEGQQTYLQYFTGGSSFSAYIKMNDSALKEYDTLNNKSLDTLAGVSPNAQSVGNVITNRELAFVFMQIKSIPIETVLGNMGKAGATVGGAAFMSPAGKGITKLLTFSFTKTGLVGLGIGLAAGIGIAGYGAYNAYQGQLAAAGYCGDFTSKEKEKEGCSLVQGVNYNFGDLEKMCGRIEGRV